MGQVADRPVGAILGSKPTFVEQHPNRLDGVQRHAVRAFEDESHGGIRQAGNEAVEALGITSSLSGSSERETELRRPAPQSGRRSSRSGRASVTMRIGGHGSTRAGGR